MKLFKIMPSRQKGLQEAFDGLQRTDIPLISYTDDASFQPTATNDDSGIFWLIPKFAKLFDIELTTSTTIFFFSIIIASITILTYGFFKLFKKKKERVLSLVLSISIGIFFLLKYDVYIFYLLGISFLPLIIYEIQLYNLSQKKIRLLIFLSLVSTSAWYFNFFRTQSGTVLMLFTAIYILFNLKDKFLHKIMYLVVIISSMAFSKYHFKQLVNNRDEYIKKENPSAFNAHTNHVIWHSIYIGLGYISNKYVSEYKDEEAIKKVKSVSEDIKYCSTQYELTLKNAFFTILKESPLLVLKIFGIKLLVILSALFVCLLPGIIFYKKNKVRLNFLIPFVLSIGFSVLPGLLVVPRLNYLSQALSIAVILSFIVYLNTKNSFISA